MGEIAYVRTGVADVREQPDQRAELFSQLLLGDRIFILEERDRWLRCRCSDGSEGWLNRGFITRGAGELADRPEGELLVVRALATAVYAEPDTRSQPLQLLPDGVRMAAVKLMRAWYEVLLPNGVRGWSPARYLKPVIGLPAASVETIADYSRSLCGIPYLWGGTSSFGFDCSGLTQHVYRMAGTILPRNSSQQAGVGIPVDIGNGFADLHPGDLLFFAENGRVNHVGISLGGASLVHASMGNGQSAINDLLPGMARYHERLAEMFHSARRIVSVADVSL